jgi:hypothetical protein
MSQTSMTGADFDLQVVSGRNFISAASGIDLLCGAGAVVLGILALNGYSFTLTFVAFLILGCAGLLTGVAQIPKSAGTFHR